MGENVLPPLLFIRFLKVDKYKFVVLWKWVTLSGPDRTERGDHIRIFQVLSSTLMSLQSSPSMIGSFPFNATLSFFFCIVTTRSRARVPLGTGTTMSSSASNWVHVYGSALNVRSTACREDDRGIYQLAPLPRELWRPCRVPPSALGSVYRSQQHPLSSSPRVYNERLSHLDRESCLWL